MKRWTGLAGYCAGSIGVNFAMWPIASLLLYFLTETAGFSVALATVVITAPKLWDIVVDPFIGAWADRHSTQRGQRSAMLMLAALTLPGAATLVFLLPSQAQPWLAAVIVALLIVTSSAFTVFLISHVALADDMERAAVARRDTVLAVRVVGQAAGSMCAGAMGPMLISALGGGSAAYRGMAVVLAIPAIVGLLIVAMTARHIPTRRQGTALEGAGGLGAALRAVLSNRMAGTLILSNFFLYVASAIVTTFMPYLNKQLLGEPDSSMSILYSCIMVGMVAGSAVAASVTRRLSRPTALLAAAALMTLSTAFFLPGCAPGARMLAAGILLVWGLGLGMYSLLIFSAMIDASAPAETLGTAPAAGAGLLLGLLISTGKIGDSLGGVLTGAMLSWSGYVPNVAPVGSVLHSLRLSYSAVVFVAMGLSLLALLPFLRVASPRRDSTPSLEGVE